METLTFKPDALGTMEHDISNEMFVKENQDIQKIISPMTLSKIVEFKKYRNPAQEFSVSLTIT